MTLDPDCIRDILLAVENCSFEQRLSVEQLTTILGKYSKEEIQYTCFKLHEGGLLDVTLIKIIGHLRPQIKSINDLTYDGHQFVNNIRSNSIWTKIKEVMKQIGASSVPVITQIALDVPLNALKDLFKKH